MPRHPRALHPLKTSELTGTHTGSMETTQGSLRATEPFWLRHSLGFQKHLPVLSVLLKNTELMGNPRRIHGDMLGLSHLPKHTELTGCNRMSLGISLLSLGFRGALMTQHLTGAPC